MREKRREGIDSIGLVEASQASATKSNPSCNVSRCEPCFASIRAAGSGRAARTADKAVRIYTISYYLANKLVGGAS